MKILFIPVSVVGGLIAGMAGKRIFNFAWGLIDEEEAPTAKHRDVRWSKLILAAALQGAIFRATKTVVDRNTRQAFAGLTGTWPGEVQPDPE